MPSKKVNDILSGCEDLLNDVDLPREQSGRIQNNNTAEHNNSISSSQLYTPGSSSRQRPPQGASVSSSSPSRDKAWGRAIDKYVASVLEDSRSEETNGDGSNKSGGGRRSHRSGKGKKSNRRQHPDNHLLAALQSDSKSMASSGSGCSVSIDGRIDDSSFEPINPFDLNNDSSSPQRKKSCGRWYKQVEWVKKYLKEEWKPISLIVLVIFVTIIISAVKGGDGNEDMPKVENPGFAMDGGDNGITSSNNIAVETDVPTFSPTWNEEYPTFVPTNDPVTEQPTYWLGTEIPTASPNIPPSESPTDAPTSGYPSLSPISKPTPTPTRKPSVMPTVTPTVSPTMPEKYYEMKKAVIHVSGSEPFDTTSSPQSLAFHWLYFEGNPSTTLYEFFEQYATAVIFFSLTKARTSYAYMNPNGVYDTWTGRKDVCGWEGVRCAFNYTSEMVHITEINMNKKNVTGAIPKEIGFLPYVNKLDFSENEISGTIPDAIYGLKRLRHLFLNSNKLTGSISPNIDNLNLAEQIYLGQNALTGSLPTNIGSNRPNNWRFFSVYENQLTGQIHHGMKLKNAYMLDFSKNDFYGMIPSDISQENFSTLRLLYMDHNSLTGTIPGSLMQIKKMKGLFLNDNSLEGMLPYQIDEDQKVGMLTIRVQNNRLTQPVARVFCDLDVNLGYYELVELAVDCAICPDGCKLCRGRCY